MTNYIYKKKIKAELNLFVYPANTAQRLSMI